VISVLLPYRDAAPTLREAMGSVLSDLGPDDELVAIDDASRDESADIVASLRDRRIVPVVGPGRGIADALARGLDASRGEFVARMDADDVSLPGRFAAERALLDSDPSLGAVAVQIETFGGPAAGLARYVAWQNALVTPDDHARSIYVESPLCHPATMMRRAAIDAAGGFLDPPWHEDWDLFLRIFRAGYRLAKVPRVLFRWRRSTATVTARDPRCSRARLVDLRAFHLAPRLDTFGIWGAGQTGRRLGRALAHRGKAASFFVDIDPTKIGRTAFGAPIVSAEAGLARAVPLVVAVGAPGARETVRARLLAAGLEEGAGFVCA
jgi:hypothetical protein